MADYDFSAPSKAEKEQFESEYNLAPPTAEELSQLESDSEEYSKIQQAKDFARTLAQGASFGFSDEAIAAARSLLGTPYEKAVKEEREAVKKFEEEYPTGSVITELAGGLIPGLITGGASLAETATATGAKQLGKGIVKKGIATEAEKLALKAGAQEATELAAKSGIKELAGKALAEGAKETTKLPVATPFKDAILKSAKIGATAGGVTAYGKQEELAPDLEGIATGAALGGALGAGIPAAIKGVKAITPSTETLEQLFPRTTTAFKYAKEKGIRLGSEEAAGELDEATEGVMKKLMDAEKRTTSSINKMVKNATDEGMLIGGTEDPQLAKLAAGEEAPNVKKIKEIVEDAKDLKGLFQKDDKILVEDFIKKAKPEDVSQIEAKIAELEASDPLRGIGGITPEFQAQKEALLAKKAMGFEGYSPEELHVIKQKFDAAYERVKGDPALSPDTKSKIKNVANTIKNIMDESLGDDYRALNSRKHSLFNAFESIMNRGEAEKASKYKGGSIGSGRKKLQGSLRRMIRKSETRTTSSDQYLKARDEDLASRLDELYNKEKDLVERGVVSSEDSLFGIGMDDTAPLGLSPENIVEEITEKAKVQDARLGSIGRFKEKTGLKVITSPMQFLGSELPVDVAGVAGQVVRKGEQVASKIESLIPKVAKSASSDVANLSRSLFSFKPASLGSIASKLSENPETERYGKALEQAANEENEHKKNAAIFAAMQNPRARQLINENMNVLEQESPSRSPAAEKTKTPSEDYTQKRFEFITGFEGKRKSEGQHVVYRDASESRNPTIGYGFNLSAPGNRELFKQALNADDNTFDRVKRGELSISENQAQKLFNIAVDQAGKILDQKLQKYNINPSILSDNQRLALESLVYNSPNLLGPKILNALADGDMDKAAKLIEITSNESGLRGLVDRRIKEARLFASQNKFAQKEGM